MKLLQNIFCKYVLITFAVLGKLGYIYGIENKHTDEVNF